MNKEFIPYEEALALKELGFDEACLAFYDGKGTEQVYFNSYRNGSGDYEPFKKSERLTWFGAPLYQQAFRWFRGKYDLHMYIEVFSIETDKTVYDFVILDDNSEEEDYGNVRYIIYEEAELACLRKLIEIAKNK